MVCIRCGDDVMPERAALGFRLCLFCGEEAAKQERATWCVVPLHKSNYVLVTDRREIPGMCSKTNYTHGKEGK